MTNYYVPKTFNGIALVGKINDRFREVIKEVEIDCNKCIIIQTNKTALLHSLLNLYCPNITLALGKDLVELLAGEVWNMLKNKNLFELRGKYYFTKSNHKFITTYDPTQVDSEEAYKGLVEDLKVCRQHEIKL